MADDSDDAIYVDVKARLDEASVDEAESELKDRFKDVATNIGDSLKDATKNIGDHVKDVTKGIGDSFKDYLDKDIKDSVRDFGHELRDQVKSGDVKGALDDVEHTVRNTTDLVTGLGEAFGVNLDGVGSAGKTIADTLSDLGTGVDTVNGKIHSVTDGLHALRSGDIAKGVNSLGDAFHGLLPDGLQDGLSGALQVFNDTHDAVKDTVDTVHELRGALGFAKGAGIAGGEAGLATSFLGPEVALPVAALAAAGYGAYKGIPALINDDHIWQDQGIPVPQHALGGLPGPATSLPMTPSSQLPSFASLDMPDDPSDPSNLKQYANAPTSITPVVRDSGRGGGGGSSNVQAQTATVEAGSATVMASSVSLGGISLSQVMGSIPSSVGAGTITNQINDPRSKALSGMGLGPLPTPAKSWWSTSSFAGKDMPGKSSGGVLPGGSPGHDNMLGSLPGGKSVGLEGGEFVVNPDATQNNMALLQAINAGGLSHFDDGGQVDSSGVGSSAPPPTQPNMPAGPKQQQGLGSGSGFGVSGGAIGMAEQAGVMAAAIGGFGGGGMAAQIGMQELNLAAQKGGQLAAAAAMAPIETFGLKGGQMGAPSVNPAGGWAGKLIGGMLGQQFNAPNLAGATHAPKQPEEKPEDPTGKPGASPSGGPSGAKEDPIHVKSVTPPAGPPPGSATSAMSTVGAGSAIPGLM